LEPITRRAFLVTAAAFPIAASAQTPAPSDAYLYIIWPNEGQRIKGAFWCRFGLRNMGVTRAGDKSPNVGHHHLLVDVDGPLNPDEPIPTGRNYLHFGAGQTEARLDLPPGPHTLQLVLGDADHKPFTPLVISKKVRITVIGSTPQATVSNSTGTGSRLVTGQ
jgi:Domain of unknown function (DUF4399)